MKCTSVVGVCKPLEAIFAIAEIERPEDRDYSFSRYVRLSRKCEVEREPMKKEKERIENFKELI